MNRNLNVFDISVYAHNFSDEWLKLSSELSVEDIKALSRVKNPLVNKTVVKISERVKDLSTLEKMFYQVRWAILFTEGNPRNPYKFPFWSVGVMDSKPYWRSVYYPEYKQGRPPKPYTLSVCLEYALKVAASFNIPMLSYPGFEADDIAATLVKYHRLSKYNSDLKSWNAISHIYLNTVDSDWIQLVSDVVTWVNTGPWEPIIRDTVTSLDWIKKRLKVSLQHPQDIVPIKCIQGDKSDNLPPGTLPYLIDLANPPSEYNLFLYPGFMSTLYDLDWGSQHISYEVYQSSSKALTGIYDLHNAVKALRGGLIK